MVEGGVFAAHQGHCTALQGVFIGLDQPAKTQPLGGGHRGVIIIEVDRLFSEGRAHGPGEAIFFGQPAAVGGIIVNSSQ